MDDKNLSIVLNKALLGISARRQSAVRSAIYAAASRLNVRIRDHEPAWCDHASRMCGLFCVAIIWMRLWRLAEDDMDRKSTVPRLWHFTCELCVAGYGASWLLDMDTIYKDRANKWLTASWPNGIHSFLYDKIGAIYFNIEDTIAALQRGVPTEWPISSEITRSMFYSEQNAFSGFRRDPELGEKLLQILRAVDQDFISYLKH